jgi:WD40 repeat protein
LNVLNGHIQTVTSAKFVSSDNYIVSCSNDSTVCLWDFKNQSKPNLFVLRLTILQLNILSLVNRSNRKFISTRIVNKHFRVI